MVLPMSHAKISVSVPFKLLSWVDGKVEKGVFKGNSHAVSVALRLLKNLGESEKDLEEIMRTLEEEE